MKKITLISALLIWVGAAGAVTNINQIMYGNAQTDKSLKTILTDSHRQSLYVFDPDMSAGKPVCNAKCAEVWPPLTVSEAEVATLAQMNPELSVQKRDSGLNQVTFKGRPVYLFHLDRQAGDIKGDGLNGVWHIIEVK